MKRKMISSVTLILSLAIFLSTVFRIQPVKASGTIYIRVDGSIDPPDAPLISVDNVTYTLTNNIASAADGIAVERSNITIDGAGYKIEGIGAYESKGICLSNLQNVIVKNTSIVGFWYGIWLWESFNNSMSGNYMSGNNGSGVRLSGSPNNSVVGNNVANNGDGIYLYSSSNNNSVSGNNVTANNGRGIWLPDSYDNIISGNNVAANNGAGIWLSGSPGNNIFGNNVAANNGCGIWLSGSPGNNIFRNQVTANIWRGIFLSDSYLNSIWENQLVANNKHGIYLYFSSNNSVSGNNVTANNWHGIYLYSSFNNSMSENMFNNDGLVVWDSYKNLVWNNTVNGKPLIYLESVSDLTIGDSGQVVLVRCSYITVENLNACNTTVGIQLWETNNTEISRSSITNNDYGIWLWYSFNNSIYHNNFINNTRQILSGHSSNSWDDGYPSGGNYWSDYIGVDEKTGLDQNQYGSDGIGDTSYDVDTSNRDRYPLMGKISYFNATSQNQVQTISNSLISGFQFNGTAIIFNVAGEEDTVGFCRILIPTALMNATYNVFVNVTEVLYTILPLSNSTQSYLYFIYNHSTQEVIITQEFPSIIILSLLMTLTVLIVLFAKGKILGRTKPRLRNTTFLIHITYCWMHSL